MPSCLFSLSHLQVSVRQPRWDAEDGRLWWAGVFHCRALELASSKLHSESKHCRVVMKSSESQQTWEEERLQNWDEYSKDLPWIYPIKGYTQISGFRTIPATFAGCSLTRAIPTTPSGCSLTNILRGVLSPAESQRRPTELNNLIWASASYIGRTL